VPSLTLGPTTLAYERAGDAGDPTVLVHGAWGDRRTWSRVVAGLSPGLVALSYDRRGHGESRGPRRTRPVRNDAEDLASLLEAVDLVPAHVIATASAAAVGLRLALDRPELVRSLVLHDPPFLGLIRPDPGADRMADEIARLASLDARDPEASALEFLRLFDGGAGTWDHLGPSARADACRSVETWGDELGDPEAFLADPAELRALSVPVLATAGERSPPGFARIVGELAREVPMIATLTIPDAGVLPELVDPDRLVGVLASYLLERNVPST
jgi:pimeloyl-ACP methyl ester carboxylesterase